MADKILRIYIEIGGVEPLVVDKILRKYIVIGGIEPLVVDILRVFGVRGEVIWSIIGGLVLTKVIDRL